MLNVPIQYLCNWIDRVNDVEKGPTYTFILHEWDVRYSRDEQIFVINTLLEQRPWSFFCLDFIDGIAMKQCVVLSYELKAAYQASGVFFR